MHSMNWLLSLILSAVPIVLLGQNDPPIGVEEREKVLVEVARQIEATYVLPEAARKIAEVVRSLGMSDQFARPMGSIEFAKAVNRRMQEAHPDVHLALHYSPAPLPDDLKAPASREILQAMELAVKRTNFGVVRLEHLAGNVGYIRIDAFHSPELAAQTVLSAMGFVANADGLIIDLRENQGGDPQMVAYFSSFLLGPAPVHLNDLESRSPKSLRQFWTIPTDPRLRFRQAPVYVLTSERTVSAGEEFAYGLQAQKRVKVVGAKTAGGAHLTSGVKVHSHFVLTVPFARAVNPKTQTNWERRGVEPDIPVAAGEALLAAHEDALLSIASREADPSRQRMLQDQAARLRSERSAARK